MKFGIECYSKMYDGALKLSDLETRGFLVVKNFLNTTEIKVLKWGYEQLRLNNTSDNDTKHYYEDFKKMFCVPSKVSSIILPKIKQVSDQITTTTGIKIDFEPVQCTGFYADLKFINGNDGNDSTLVWHQDQGAWTYHQQSYNYINFYIMVDKDDPTITNLSVIPQDIILDKLPDHADRIVRKGAQRFFPKDDETLVKNDDTDEEYTLPINIETIAEHPNLSPGDVLLVRGDILHRSQDNFAPRIAASFRVFENSIINKQKLLAGGEEKHKYLKNNKDRIDPLIESFEYFERDDVTFTEYFNYMNKLL